MSVNFGQLKTQIGQRCGDTGTTFATIIGYYINQRYREILRRFNQSSVVADYTITASSGASVTAAAIYTLPSDFGKELYVFNESTNRNLTYVPLDELVINNPSEINSTGTLESYSIYTMKNTTAASAEASAARVQKIRFWRAASMDNTIRIPYLIRAADLSASTDELILDCETAVEYGATADGLAYKRQMAKAAQYEALYEKAIANLLWDKDYSPNRLPMMGVQPLNRNEGID